MQHAWSSGDRHCTLLMFSLRERPYWSRSLVLSTERLDRSWQHFVEWEAILAVTSGAMYNVDLQLELHQQQLAAEWGDLRKAMLYLAWLWCHGGSWSMDRCTRPAASYYWLIPTPTQITSIMYRLDVRVTLEKMLWLKVKSSLTAPALTSTYHPVDLVWICFTSRQDRHLLNQPIFYQCRLTAESNKLARSSSMRRE